MSIPLSRRFRRPLTRPALTLLTALAVAAGLLGCDRADPVFNSRFLAFGTLMDLSIIGVGRARAEAVSDAIEQDFVYMHQAWHAWDPGPLVRVNSLLAGGEWFAAPPSVLPLLLRSRELAEASGHLFDPAIGRLVDLWGFHADEAECHRPPDAEAIAALVAQNPRMSDIEVDGFRLRSSNPAVQLDFGAVGKGFGIDMAIDRLRELGIDNAIVNAGGDLRAIGSRDGHPWRIAIRSPSGGGVFGFIEVMGDESVFTSGNYERNFRWQGELYHHIIDPRTGYPARGAASVTVIHSDATTADAAATALFVAGPYGWPETARRMGIKYVLLVDENGVVHMNPAMQQRVQLLAKDHRIAISDPL
ncbi:MAG: FAD:protein FMN transferase [Gammaproteobacteria bacterium]